MGDASTMIILASLEAVATVIIVFLMLKHQTVQDQAWTAERRELLERIQRPDRIPSTPADHHGFPDAKKSDGPRASMNSRTRQTARADSTPRQDSKPPRRPVRVQ